MELRQPVGLGAPGNPLLLLALNLFAMKMKDGPFIGNQTTISFMNTFQFTSDREATLQITLGDGWPLRAMRPSA